MSLFKLVENPENVFGSGVAQAGWIFCGARLVPIETNVRMVADCLDIFQTIAYLVLHDGHILFFCYFYGRTS